MDNRGLDEGGRSGIDGQSLALPLDPAHTPEALAPQTAARTGRNRSSSIWIVQLSRPLFLAVSIYVALDGAPTNRPYAAASLVSGSATTPATVDRAGRSVTFRTDVPHEPSPGGGRASARADAAQLAR
jgi:hypothetical protein